MSICSWRLLRPWRRGTKWLRQIHFLHQDHRHWNDYLVLNMNEIRAGTWKMAFPRLTCRGPSRSPSLPSPPIHLYMNILVKKKKKRKKKLTIAATPTASCQTPRMCIISWRMTFRLPGSKRMLFPPFSPFPNLRIIFLPLLQFSLPNVPTYLPIYTIPDPIY